MSFKEFIKQHGTSMFIEKYDYVFHQGEYDGTLYYIVSGLLKAYYVSTDGKESIKSFVQIGSTIGSLSAAYKGLPCTFNLMALEDTQLIRFSFKKLLESTRTSPQIAETVIENLLTLSMRKEQREFEFLNLTAEERYKNLCENETDLVERLTQNDIARYLGVTPVALSRIKKRLQNI